MTSNFKNSLIKNTAWLFHDYNSSPYIIFNQIYVESNNFLKTDSVIIISVILYSVTEVMKLFHLPATFPGVSHPLIKNKNAMASLPPSQMHTEPSHHNEKTIHVMNCWISSFHTFVAIF